MASMSERLAYVLSFSTDGAVRDLQKFGAAADRELGKADKRIDQLGRNMQKIGLGAMAFSGIAGAGLFSLAQGAGEAAAGMEALEQVVGETVAQDIEKWAEGSAKSVGLSSRAAVNAATTFAQLGKIIGLGGQDLAKFSTDLTGLAADFAAFKNVSPEQALEDIQAAFAGSTEVMRKYGIFLDDATLKAAYFRETGEQVAGTLTAEQKILAINAEMYRQGADMVGQFGREQGQLGTTTAQLKANLQNLADSIGAGVLPMVSGMVGVANDAASAFGDLSPDVQSTVGTIAGFGVAAIGAAGALSFTIGKVVTARDRFAALGASLRGPTGNLSKLGTAVTGVGTLIAAGTIAYGLYASAKAEAEERTATFTAALQAEAEGQENATDLAITAALASERFTEARKAVGVSAQDAANFIRGQEVPAMSSLVEAMDEGRYAIEAWAKAQGVSVADALVFARELDDQRDAFEAATEGAQRHEETLSGLSGELDSATRSYIAQGEAIQDALPELDSATRSYIAQGEAIIEAAEAAAAHEEAVKANTDAVAEHRSELERLAEIEQEAADRIQETIDARRAAADSQYALNDAQRSFAEQLVTANETLANSEGTMTDVAAAMDDTARAAGSVADAAVRLAEEQAVASGTALSASESAQVWRGAMMDQAAAASGPLRDAILGYIAAVDDIPPEKLSQIRALIDEGKLAEANRLLNNAARTRTAIIRTRLVSSSGQPVYETESGARFEHLGGSSPAGFTNIAGERGLEFAGRSAVLGAQVVPSGTQVTSTRTTAAMVDELIGELRAARVNGGGGAIDMGALAAAVERGAERGSYRAGMESGKQIATALRAGSRF